MSEAMKKLTRETERLGLYPWQTSMDVYQMLLAELSDVILPSGLRHFAAAANRALGGKSLNQVFSEDPQRAFAYVEALKGGAYW